MADQYPRSVQKQAGCHHSGSFIASSRSIRCTLPWSTASVGEMCHTAVSLAQIVQCKQRTGTFGCVCLQQRHASLFRDWKGSNTCVCITESVRALDLCGIGKWYLCDLTGPNATREDLWEERRSLESCPRSWPPFLWPVADLWDTFANELQPKLSSFSLP